LLQEQRQLTEASKQLASQVVSGGEGKSTSSLLSLQQTNNNSFLQDLHLDGTFSVVIAGEFNAGKSTLINALLGTKLLETGALPTTDSITIVAADIASSNTPQQDDEDNTIVPPLGVIVHTVNDLPLLEDLTLIDSPGTNSTWIDHTERTLKLLPSADLILFVTSADRPFSDSERTLLQGIQTYRKSIVVVINKMDILDTSGGDHGQEQKQAVVDFVTDKAGELLGARPVVIPVSSRDALSAKLMEKKPSTSTSQQSQSTAVSTERSGVWHRSNFESLETFLKESLTTQTKLKSKLSNPIGVVEGVMAECLEVLKTEREELQVDIATLNIFQSQFEGWKNELSADLKLARSTMSRLVQQEGHRCDLLLSRMNPYNFFYWTLIDTNQLQEEWDDTKREVSAHSHETLKEDLIEAVHETAYVFSSRNIKILESTVDYLILFLSIFFFLLPDLVTLWRHEVVHRDKQ
jgi:small GTP-binding protein